MQFNVRDLGCHATEMYKKGKITAMRLYISLVLFGLSAYNINIADLSYLF